jgi:carbon-monoxide dehydrogenase medium subunit
MKLMRRRVLDLALVGVAVFLKMDENGKACEEARIGLGAVAPTPVRAKKAEDILKSKVIDDALAVEAGEVASQEASPISDIRATKEYRTEMIKVLTKRAVLMARSRMS